MKVLLKNWSQITNYLNFTLRFTHIFSSFFFDPYFPILSSCFTDTLRSRRYPNRSIRDNPIYLTDSSRIVSFHSMLVTSFRPQFYKFWNLCWYVDFKNELNGGTIYYATVRKITRWKSDERVWVMLGCISAICNAWQIQFTILKTPLSGILRRSKSISLLMFLLVDNRNMIPAMNKNGSSSLLCKIRAHRKNEFQHNIWIVFSTWLGRAAHIWPREEVELNDWASEFSSRLLKMNGLIGFIFGHYSQFKILNSYT